MSLNDVARSTREKRLRYVDSLYSHADLHFGTNSLDNAIGCFDEASLEGILESWLVSIVNHSKQTTSDESRWRTGLDFVSTVLLWLTKTAPSEMKIYSLQGAIHRLSNLYGQLHVAGPRKVAGVRSLPANVVEELYSIVDPVSTKNPFSRERTRWLVYTCFIILMHQGLRRGELLLLPTDAVKSEFDQKSSRERSWINVETNPYEDESTDSRHSRPGIKTAQSIRQIPVSATVADIIQTYVENFRGRPDHAYLANSQQQLPLSTESLTKMFSKISSVLPSSLITTLSNRAGRSSVTPHDLRHTCATVRLHQLLRQGDSMDEATQKLRSFFGWSRESMMPLRYARAVFEDRLMDVWTERFDSQIDLIRSTTR
jgi:integrase